MKTISCWGDLRPYGFDTLTGEACGLTYRILFDVTANGRTVIGKCFGMPEPRLAEAWNRGAEDDPNVGSIMLSPEMLLPLAAFALLESGCTRVLFVTVVVGAVSHRRAIGIEPSDDPQAVGKLTERCPPDRVLRYSGTAGDRNVHMISGRVT